MQVQCGTVLRAGYLSCMCTAFRTELPCDHVRSGDRHCAFHSSVLIIRKGSGDPALSNRVFVLWKCCPREPDLQCNFRRCCSLSLTVVVSLLVVVTVAVDYYHKPIRFLGRQKYCRRQEYNTGASRPKAFHRRRLNCCYLTAHSHIILLASYSTQPFLAYLSM